MLIKNRFKKESKGFPNFKRSEANEANFESL